MMIRWQASHVDAHALPFERLSDYVPPPGTRTWKPIAHADFAKVVRETIDKHGYGIDREQYAVTKNGRRMFGVFDLLRQGMEIAGGEVGLSIGIRNSVDKSIAGTILVGERIFICSNLSFSATVVVFRKHTKFFSRDLEAKVHLAIACFDEHIGNVSRKVDRLKAMECSDRMAHDTIIRAADAGACRWRDIPKILRAWRVSKHYEFEPRNAWSLYNAFTEVNKGWFKTGPQQAATASLKLNSLAPFAEVG